MSIESSNIDLANPDYYINREFSALAFNSHVLQQACDDNVPLLERLKFLFIVSSNLDEFFEVRVAGIKEKIALGSTKLSIDGLTPQQVLKHISETAHQLIDTLYQTYNQKLIPQLAQHGITFINEPDWSEDIIRWTKRYFVQEVLPILSPIGLDLAHPFPRIINKSLNFIVSLSGKDAFGRHLEYAIVHAPRSLPRAIRLPSNIAKTPHQFVHLSSIMRRYVENLFPGMTVSGCHPFRLTRNSDLFLHEEEIEDLAKAMKSELFTRHYGHAVRLEIDQKCPQPLVDFLIKKHHLTKTDAYFCDGPVNLRSYMTILNQIDLAKLKYPKLNYHMVGMRNQALFDILRKQDILVHHPYQSFNIVIDFVRQAAQDPQVLAIKQTLYRTHTKSLMVKALIEAARSGKEVTAVIELKARFSEESNLHLANKFLQAGVLVVYGVVGHKSHAKMTLVVRREQNTLKRYVHLGTGNYHDRTAKQYTDIGLFTSDYAITRDTQIIFHQLTGLGKTVRLNSLYYSPFTLQKKLLRLIDLCIKEKLAGKPVKIVLKANGITDKKIIKALYKASQAGIKIHLIIRTLCCLRPGIKEVSSNIKVTSHIDRFLEHHRVYYFKIGRKELIYGSSADLMERNLYKRIEVMFPINDETLKQRIKKEIIENYSNNTRRCWHMRSNGSYHYKNREKPSAQESLLSYFSFHEI